MSRKLVTIVTGPEAEKCDQRTMAGSTSNILRCFGYDIPYIEHFLVHRQFKVTYHILDPKPHYGKATGYITCICNNGHNEGGGLYYSLKEVKERLHHLAETFVSKYEAPYFVITSGKRYPIVARVFEDLGCRVKRLIKENPQYDPYDTKPVKKNSSGKQVKNTH